MLVVGLPASLREYHFISDPGQPKIVSEWRSELGAEIVFNGSYFNEDGTPSGLWKAGKGKSAVPWPSLEDQADPNGYTFAVTALVDGLHFQYLPANPSEETVDETFLSFPTLVADGKPLVKVDSGLLARRTAVAEDVDGVKYVIVTEKGTLSLYELSRWLVEQPEQFVIAGNLDGGPSTGLSMQSGLSKIEVPSAPISNVIAIWNRE
jgi:exopolysaccharide biosynthesis protein